MSVDRLVLGIQILKENIMKTKKHLSKHKYEQRKYLKKREKNTSDKQRKTRSEVDILYKKWEKEDKEIL